MYYVSESETSVLGDEDEKDEEDEEDEDGKDSEDDRKDEDEKDEEDEKDSEDKDAEDDKDDSSDDGSEKKSSTRTKVKEIEEDTKDEIEDEVENELEDELEYDSLSKVGVSGKAKIKKVSDVGELELSIEDDGKVGLKVKFKDSKLGEDFEEEIEASDSEELVSVLPKKEGESKIKIKRNGDSLEIETEADSAATKFPISIDPTTHIMVVTTPSGNVTLHILPNKAIENLLKSKKVQTVASSEIVENKGKLGADKIVYKVKGYRTDKFLGLVPVSSEVEAEVGAESGLVLKVDDAWYLKLFGFLFKA